MVINFDYVRDKYRKLLGKRNYIYIQFFHTNNEITLKKIELDKFDNFEVLKHKYTIQDMKEFVTGYYKNCPLFLFDNNFILPLKISKESLIKKIKKSYEKELESKTIDEKEEIISSIVLKIKPSVLKMVYDHKLLHDLYNANKNDSIFNSPYFMYILIGIALIIAYYTGLLDKLMEIIGV